VRPLDLPPVKRSAVVFHPQTKGRDMPLRRHEEAPRP
jgi:hypothetical protein